jgi:hypothetical protein
MGKMALLVAKNSFLLPAGPHESMHCGNDGANLFYQKMSRLIS